MPTLESKRRSLLRKNKMLSLFNEMKKKKCHV
jgi:hypothetical protein